MRFKGTAALLLILLVLGGRVYWTDIRGREERIRAEEAAGLLLPVEPDQIEEIRLIYPGTTLSAARVGTGWEFVTPEGLEADSAAWDSVAANVGRIERDSSLEEGATDLSVYGLEAPELVVEVGLAGGDTEQIRFGDQNPAGEFNYTTLASDPGIVLTATTWRGLFLKEANDLRDRTLLRFEQSQIDRIELPGSGIRLAREEDEWFLEGPPRLRADDSEVSSFLSSLATTRASGFGDEDVPPFGSSSDLAVLHDTASGEEHVLVFGPPADSGSDMVYARDRSRDVVFTVGVGLKERVLRPVSAWRDKTIADVDRDSVTTIEIAHSGEASFLLTKTGDQWAVAGGQMVSADRVGEMLGAFDFQRASEVVDAPGALETYGLDSPRLRVRFGGMNGDLLEFSFGDEAATGGNIYWKSAGEDAVKLVPGSIMAPFDVRVDELTEAEEE
jgi:hypothetical protein